MTRILSCSLLAGCLLAGSFSKAGDLGYSKEVIEMTEMDPWADTIRPITNPTHFDLAIPQNIIHPIFIYNSMPSTVDTIIGGVPLGGHYEVYALQIELALNERLSINATKDGYIKFRPDNTLKTTEGFANIGAGVKYAWLLRPEERLASNFQLLFEFPSGHTEVWQGEGDGVIIPSVSTLKHFGGLQLANQFGFKLPVDSDAESSIFYTSAHVSYKLTEWFYPLAEINYFRVMDAGDGRARFGEQLGGALPSLPTFEAGDLVNWGASNAGMNPDFVTGALGFRLICPNQPVTVGFAWETPLTTESEGLMDNRFTVDMTIKF
ncbi:MAG: hypothetical protein CMO55_23905 [Verrucomicrobiales bacterium]|nr:hypothetical protein [Verrucomicrobiales bacterium]